jgi:predicted DNA-binding ribbon-helix-helix protein
MGRRGDGVHVHKVTVRFSDEQLVWLNEVARQRNLSVSDIIRRLTDETRGAYLTPAGARRATG